MYDGCVLPPNYARMLYVTSYSNIPSVAYAIYRGYYGMACVPFMVFLSSVLYWYKPEYSWRRTLDITVVQVALVINLIIAAYAENGITYYITTLVAVLFYEAGKMVYIRGMLLQSTTAHVCLHIIANIANVILYSGRIAI